MIDDRYRIGDVYHNFKELVPGGALDKNHVKFAGEEVKRIAVTPRGNTYSIDDIQQIAEVVKEYGKAGEMSLEDVIFRLSKPVVHSWEKGMPAMTGVFI